MPKGLRFCTNDLLFLQSRVVAQFESRNAQTIKAAADCFGNPILLRAAIRKTGLELSPLAWALQSPPVDEFREVRNRCPWGLPPPAMELNKGKRRVVLGRRLAVAEWSWLSADSSPTIQKLSAHKNGLVVRMALAGRRCQPQSIPVCIRTVFARQKCTIRQ
jgi:hypothetical protein